MTPTAHFEWHLVCYVAPARLDAHALEEASGKDPEGGLFLQKYIQKIMQSRRRPVRPRPFVRLSVRPWYRYPPSRTCTLALWPSDEAIIPCFEFGVPALGRSSVVQANALRAKWAQAGGLDLELMMQGKKGKKAMLGGPKRRKGARPASSSSSLPDVPPDPAVSADMPWSDQKATALADELAATR